MRYLVGRHSGKPTREVKVPGREMFRAEVRIGAYVPLLERLKVHLLRKVPILREAGPTEEKRRQMREGERFRFRQSRVMEAPTRTRRLHVVGTADFKEINSVHRAELVAPSRTYP